MSRISRTTTRLAQLPQEAPALLLVNEYLGGFFRVTTVTEEVQEWPDGTITYTVTPSGPVVNKNGKDHASRCGKRSFTDRYKDETEDPALDPLRQYLVGKGRMTRPLVDIEAKW